MRAREFTINVPIQITIDGDGDVKTNMSDNEPEQERDEDEQPVMTPPLQQQIELQKAALGKNSEVIDDLVDDDDEEECDDCDGAEPVIKDLASHFWKQTPNRT